MDRPITTRDQIIGLLWPMPGQSYSSQQYESNYRSGIALALIEILDKLEDLTRGDP